MKRSIILAVLTMIILSSCINQEEKTTQWTIEEWKTHLFLPNPTMDQSISNMAAGLNNIQQLAPGTHIVFEGGGRVKSYHSGPPLSSYGMTVSIKVLDKENIGGIECSVAKIDMEIRTNIEGELISIDITGKEWIDAAGNPKKIDGEITMELYEGMGTTMKTNLEQTGQEQYEEYDCWVFSGTQTTELMGISGLEEEITQYMDKESYTVVATFVDGEEQKMSQEYRDVTTFISELEWELGGRKKITTELGTFNCQVIHLKEDSKKVGTIWVHEDFRAPLKYEITYEMKDVKLEITMKIIEYIE